MCKTTLFLYNNYLFYLCKNNLSVLHKKHINIISQRACAVATEGGSPSDRNRTAAAVGYRTPGPKCLLLQREEGA